MKSGPLMDSGSRRNIVWEIRAFVFYYFLTCLRIIVPACSLGGSAGLLREEEVVDVGHHTTISDRNVTEKLAELLVVSHRELDVTWNDSCLFVVSCGISGQLKNLKCTENSSRLAKMKSRNPNLESKIMKLAENCQTNYNIGPSSRRYT